MSRRKAQAALLSCLLALVSGPAGLAAEEAAIAASSLAAPPSATLAAPPTSAAEASLARPQTPAAAGALAEAPATRWSAESSLGLDGGAAALFLAPRGGRLSLGLRLGLGLELADFRWNDPSASLALRFRLVGAGRLEGWIGAVAGAIALDTGYDRFALPFIGAEAGCGFRLAGGLWLFAEAGGRYGRRDRRYESSLAFLDASYAETVFAMPAVLRLGLALRF